MRCLQLSRLVSPVTVESLVTVGYARASLCRGWIQLFLPSVILGLKLQLPASLRLRKKGKGHEHVVRKIWPNEQRSTARATRSNIFSWLGITVTRLSSFEHTVAPKTDLSLFKHVPNSMDDSIFTLKAISSCNRKNLFCQLHLTTSIEKMIVSSTTEPEKIDWTTEWLLHIIFLQLVDDTANGSLGAMFHFTGDIGCRLPGTGGVGLRCHWGVSHFQAAPPNAQSLCSKPNVKLSPNLSSGMLKNGEKSCDRQTRFSSCCSWGRMWAVLKHNMLKHAVGCNSK